jgi:dTDP-4-dehydrorhamnose reductase
VINAAAYTDVDGCESDAGLAHAVNAEGPRNLAAACRDVGAKLVHFSTDFVFDGTLVRPYRVDDPTSPLSVYGASKLGGEVAIRESGCAHLIIRTSWLFGPHGSNFVEAILARAAAGQPLSVVTDQIGCPTLASDLADAVLRLLDAGASGTVHFCNAEPCAWHEFAVRILAEAGYDLPVARTTSDALNRPARRPAYSVLDTASYTEATGQLPTAWRDALTRYFTQRRVLRRPVKAIDQNVRSAP